MRNISIIVKPTISCNIRCKHCYHDVSSASGVMSDELLERMISFAAKEYESVWFIWHGGEPLLLPLDFYKNALRLQEKYFGKDSHRCGNTIQTNGVSMNKKFAEFCREKKVNIGVSCEGPYNSVMRTGSNAASDAIDFLQKGGHMISVSSTISNGIEERQSEIYEHFSNKGVAVSFSPVICAGCTPRETVPDVSKYIRGSIEAFDIWLNDKDAEMPLVPHYLYVLSALGDLQDSDCAHSSCLMKWISVYPNGDVYPCGKGCPESFKLGNLTDMEYLSDSFQGDAFKNILKASIERRNSCMNECDLFRYCNGGCSLDAYFEGGMNKNGNDSCIAFRSIFSHVKETVDRMIEIKDDLSQYNRFVREAIIGKLVNPSNSL